MEGTRLEATFPERFKDSTTTAPLKLVNSILLEQFITQKLSEVYSLLSHTMTDPFAETNMDTINMGFTY